jgi:ribose 5-phosphate isomerase B
MPDIRESEVRRLVRAAVDRALGPETDVKAAPSPSPETRRRVALGADHGGYALKEILKQYIEGELGWTVHDSGTHSSDAVDYPDFAAAVARQVASGRCAFGIIVDAAGIGSTMAANKVQGARCALCHDDATAVNGRAHNDANIMALGSRIVNQGLARRLVRLFLATPFEGGRHQRRVQKIMALEQSR